MKKINTSKSLIFGRECEDIKNSLEYLDQECYFSNSKDFSDYTEGKLNIVRVCNIANYAFNPYINVRNSFYKSFRYFIPKNRAVFVEEEPKKLRPFESREEFFNVTGFKVGDIVQIKKIGDLIYETAMITRIRLYLDGAYSRLEIYFGSNACSLDDLFKHYKYFKNNEWLPFGVEV